MTTRAQPIDLVHLARYTGGVRTINEEILGLFESHCREMVQRLEEIAADPGAAKTWRETTHTLKGAARGIGAFPLADAVAEAEKSVPGDLAATLRVLDRIKGESIAVLTFIAEFLAHDG
jgi:HPt (histidine-containing phosphotransfer) domain-containing protein